MGHEHVSIDYAPRSDFKMNTIYFAEKAESLAGEISGMFDGAQTQIKPLSWDSNFDLIVVTVSGSQLKNTGVSKEALKKDKQQEMAAEREALRKAKQKQEMLSSMKRPRFSFQRPMDFTRRRITRLRKKNIMMQQHF